jgi:hypothetical protein
MGETAIEKTEAAPLATVNASPLAVLESALQSGRNADELGKLHEIYRQVKADQAKADYDTAFAAFQTECPPIPRKRTAEIVGRSGGSFSYMFAALEDIDKVVVPCLNKHGFSRSFGDTIIDGDALTIECVLSHIGGHHEKRAFTVPTTTKAGMSEQQKYGSAATYAKRQAFVNVAGLRVCDLDDDGAGVPPAEPVNAEQAKTIQDLIIQSEADRVRFLKLFAVKQVSEIPGNRFEEACRMLNKKIAANRSKT